MLEFELCSSLSSLHNLRCFVEYIDTLPAEILQTKTTIRVKLKGASPSRDNYIQRQLAAGVAAQSMYWRIKTIIDKQTTHYHGKPMAHATIRPEVTVVLRAVGVADLY